MPIVLLPRDLTNGKHTAEVIEKVLFAHSDGQLRKVTRVNSPSLQHRKDKTIDVDTGIESPPETVLIHDDLGIVADDLPDDMSFGNGITCLSSLMLKDGRRLPIIAMCFDSSVNITPGRLQALRVLLDVLP